MHDLAGNVAKMSPKCRPDRQMPPDLRRHHKSGDICPQYCDVSRVDWLTLMSGSAGHGQNHGTSPLPDFERQQKLQLPFEHNPIRHPSSPSSHPIQQHEYLSLSAITIGTSILYFFVGTPRTPFLSPLNISFAFPAPTSQGPINPAWTQT